MISAVGIVVPARDERTLVEDCLLALRVALAGLPADVDRAVCVVADRCVDDTARLARSAFGGQVIVNQADLTIGEVRDLGLRRALAELGRHRPEAVWLLSTDADSTVAPDWVRQHVAHAEQGVHAVAGVAELAGPVPRRYTRVLATSQRPEGHGNVYAANLGVRADAYAAVGGFGAVATGEDHDLWQRLGRAGYRTRYAAEPWVRTSARRAGRAPGGLGELLTRLDRAGV